MRVLLANGRLGFRSGSEVHTRDLALALRGRGHDVSVFVGVLREDDDVRTLRSAGVLVTDDREVGSVVARDIGFRTALAGRNGAEPRKETP